MVGKSARFLAPVALAAVAVGVYLIVESTVVHDHTTVTHNTNSTIVRTRHPRHKSAKPRVYVVKSGDTLSAIAGKTGVPLARLTALNPAVSAPPYSLQTGQRLRLRR
jgi:LysM repeat protein